MNCAPADPLPELSNGIAHERRTHDQAAERVRRHNVATLAALVTFAALVFQSFSGMNFHNGINALVVLVLFVAIIVMFATRNADEYVAAIWRSGTSFAFVLTASVVIFLPFFEGMYDGFMNRHRGQDIDLSTDISLIVLGSFFLANGWTRLRGTY